MPHAAPLRQCCRVHSASSAQPCFLAHAHPRRAQGVEPLLAAMVVWCTPDTRPRPSKRLLGSVLLLVSGLVLGTGGQGFAHGLGTLLGLVRAWSSRWLAATELSATTLLHDPWFTQSSVLSMLICTSPPPPTMCRVLRVALSQLHFTSSPS